MRIWLRSSTGRLSVQCQQANEREQRMSDTLAAFLKERISFQTQIRNAKLEAQSYAHRVCKHGCRVNNRHHVVLLAFACDLEAVDFHRARTRSLQCIINATI